MADVRGLRLTELQIQSQHTAAHPRFEGSDRTTAVYDVEAKDPQTSAQSATAFPVATEQHLIRWGILANEYLTEGLSRRKK